MTKPTPGRASKSPKPTPSARRVLVLIDTDLHGAHLVRGIQRYARQAPPASFSLDAGEMLARPSQLRRLKTWPGQGILVRASDTQKMGLIETLKSLSLPVVNVAGWVGAQHLTSVLEDDTAVAQLGADDLLRRRLAHYAFYGRGDSARHQMRARVFRERIESAGFTCQSLLPRRLPRSERGWERHLVRLGRWLSALPKPVGIMAAHDHYGWQLLESAQASGLSVPQEVAVLGVNDNRLICSMTTPPLSSIAMPHEQMGYRAASILAGLMDGQTPPSQPVQIAPTGINSRQSTDVLAIKDAEVLGAVRFIRQYVSSPIQVGDVLMHVPLSRRSLERRFHEVLGHSPATEIRRTRLRHAKSLLVDPQYTVAQVAEASGFASPARFTVVFRKHEGMSPLQYRRKMQ